MIRLVLLLCAGIFVALMIGGQDRGQSRLGLSQPPLMPAITAKAPVAVEPVEAEATVAELVPVAAPAPARPVEVVAAAPAPVQTTPTFTLSNLEEADIATAAPGPTTVLYVAATSINVRQGPSTNDAILGRLTRNEAVSLVREAGDGWVQVRIEGDGIEGFVAARLLTDKAPAP